MKNSYFSNEILSIKVMKKLKLIIINKYIIEYVNVYNFWKGENINISI